MFEQTFEEEAAPQAIALWRRIGVGAIGILSTATLASVLGMQGFFAGMVMPGVEVGGISLGGQNLAQARLTINNAEASLHPSFVVAGKRYQPTLSDLGIQYKTEAVLTHAYSMGRDGIIPHPVHVKMPLDPIIDEARLSDYLEPIAKVGSQPSDARLEVQRGKIQIFPEVAGWSVDKSVLKRTVENNFATFHAAEPVVEPQVLAASVKADDLTLAQAEANAFMSTPVILTDNGKNISVSASDIGSWLSFSKDGTLGRISARIDTAKVNNFVGSLGNRLDVAPIDKRVTIADGVTSIQSEGTDGSAIDREPLIAAFSGLKAGEAIAVTITRHVTTFKTITTNLVGIGSGKYIEINLSKQHLWVWDNHQVIYDSPVTTGATGAGLGTVVGTFHIYSKQTNTHLVGRDYDVPVKFWMPFYLGYGLHDAIWRHGVFGGQDYWRGGSHGCVNLPDATAEYIYGWSEIGTPVWVHK